MNDHPAVTTFLFTDIEGSSRLWEEQPERMRTALARHDRILRDAVQHHRGAVVKTTGDGLHAAFDDPRDAVAASVALQAELAARADAGDLPLRVRCGIHAGVSDFSNGDYFGSAVNRAARVMSVAHGGQVLVSQAVADLIRDRVPSGVSLRDLGPVRLRDLSRAERLYQVEQAQLRRDFPALRTLEAVPNNLTQQATTFVGRAREQQEVKAALKHTRLLTLSGIGGLGKTRLSLQVAADVINDYSDGVWFVELAPITDARLVPQAVASVLGVREAAGRPVGDALVEFVRDRHILLVLDNCEHLMEACADLARQLLQAGAGVRMLASSREHFGIAGETVYTVPPLSMPESGRGDPDEPTLQGEAVRLFVERAMAAQQTFRLTEKNTPAVVEICRRLDGIPLSLELAAARMRALTVEQIAARVNDRFRLLTAGDRTALPRQQTLRAMMDWSHDLLAEPERILFRRLAVFAGGWTLEAAEAVASGDPIERGNVLDVLAELVDKSLVIVDAEGGRHRLLETVRQYAEEKLQASGEQADCRRRHLEFYLTFAEKAGAGLAGPEQPDWLRQLDADRENLLASHAWCTHDPDSAESGYQLVHAIKHYWFMRGLFNLGHRLSVESVSLPAIRSHSLPRCRALLVAGQICAYTGRYEEAQQHLSEGLDLAERHDDRRLIAAMRSCLALAALGLGDRAAAQAHCEKALELARELGSKREIAVASNALAQLSRMDGKLDVAEPLYEQALALARELGDREFEAIALVGLAMVAIGRGAAKRAREQLHQVLTIASQTGSLPARQSALEIASGLAALRQDWERSARLYGAAEAHTLLTGIQRDPADEAFLQPFCIRTREALGETQFIQADASGRGLAFEQAIAEAHAWLSIDD